MSERVRTKAGDIRKAPEAFGESMAEKKEAHGESHAHGALGILGTAMHYSGVGGHVLPPVLMGGEAGVDAARGDYLALAFDAAEIALTSVPVAGPLVRLARFNLEYGIKAIHAVHEKGRRKALLAAYGNAWVHTLLGENVSPPIPEFENVHIAGIADAIATKMEWGAEHKPMIQKLKDEHGIGMRQVMLTEIYERVGLMDSK